MGLIETLRKKGDLEVDEIKKLLKETEKIMVDDRETAHHALTMAIGLYEELERKKGTWYFKHVYPEIKEDIDKITNKLLEYQT